MNTLGLNASLLSLRVSNEDYEQGTMTRHRRLTCLFYLVGLVLGELSWLFLSIIYYSETLKEVYAFIAVTLWIIVWSSFGYKNGHMSFEQYIFWMQGCYHTLMLSFSQIFYNYHWVICGSSSGMEYWQGRKITSSKFFAYLYLWYGLLDDKLTNKGFEEYKIDWIGMILMDFYCLLGVVVFVVMLKKWRSYSTHMKWEFMCMIYPWSLMLVLCLAGSFPVEQFGFKWIWFSIINHTVFVGLCVWMHLNKDILPNLSTLNEGNEKEMMFQVSEGLLSPMNDHLPQTKNLAIDGQPLNNCTICFGVESSLCYKNCGHVCLCSNDDCALHLMSKGNKKCPMCRTESNYILEVRRVDGIYFEVINRFRIPDEVS